MGSGITSGECQAQDAINISEKEVSQWLYTPEDTVIITIILPVLLCFGVTTNFTFLFVLFRVPRIRSDTNIYLMHLALADLLYLTLAAAYFIWHYTASLVAIAVPFVNSSGCISFFILINTGYFVSIALVTMFSFERFFALCHPLKHLKIRGKQRTCRLVAICWLVGLLFSGSTVPGFAILKVLCLQWPESDEYKQFPSVVGYCDAAWPWVRYYTRPLLSGPLLIAMVANTYMYVRILQTLNKRSGTNITGKMDIKARKTRNQVAKMLVVNGVVFFLCQAPYRVYYLFLWICSLAGIPYPLSTALENAIYWVSVILLFINSAVNPLIYGAVNSKYRTAYIQAFHCKVHPRQKGPVKPPDEALRAAENLNAAAQAPTNSKTNETRL